MTKEPDVTADGEEATGTGIGGEELWTEVMELDDLWIGEMIGAEAGSEKVLLVNLDGQVHAYEDKCPHKGTPLSEGELVDGVITCSAHRWEFCAGTGCGINPANSRLTDFPVKFVDGKILVALPRREVPTASDMPE